MNVVIIAKQVGIGLVRVLAAKEPVNKLHACLLDWRLLARLALAARLTPGFTKIRRQTRRLAREPT